MRPDLRLRRAVAADVPRLEGLIARSARALCRGFYSDAQVEAAVAHIFGVDSQVIADGGYFVVADAAGAPAGCGGWSARRTLFGGDRFAGRQAGMLDPACEAARIRAFFVAPGFARQGVAAALLAASEGAAQAAGFRRAALMATLSGVPFYQQAGYRAEAEIMVEVAGSALPFVPMFRALAAGDPSAGQKATPATAAEI